MTEEEKIIIKKFAAGNKELKDEAIKIYRKCRLDSGGCLIEIKFMSEVDTPAPDYNLRSMYRKMLFPVINDR
jgi:hypothetical protein